MANRHTRSAIRVLGGAILLVAGLATAAQAASPVTARLAVKAGLFAVSADIAAERLAGFPQVAISSPPVASGTAAADTAADTAAAQVSPQTPTAEHDPAKVAIGAEIMDNLQLIEVAVVGVKMGMAQDPEFQKLPEANRARLTKLVEEEVRARKDIIDSKMAEANVDRFTIAQLKIILRLSQTKVMQDMVLYGAGLAPKPDINSAPAADQALIATYGNEPYVSDFLDHTDFSPLAAEMRIAVQAAVARFQAGQTG